MTMNGLNIHFYRAMHFSAKRGTYWDRMSSVRLSVPLVDCDCDQIRWNSSEIISPLVSLGCSLSEDPNIMGLFQGEKPEILPKVTHPLLIWASETFDHSFNKKAVLSQRWPRDARYVSRSWAVAEIWPFKIIHDGGGRHFEFVRIEISAIRSAVPENPTL